LNISGESTTVLKSPAGFPCREEGQDRFIDERKNIEAGFDRRLILDGCDGFERDGVYASPSAAYN